jgi:glycogen debranching enzyme
VLTTLAATQATRRRRGGGRAARQDPPRDPRRRDGALGEVPFRLYYGSVDATPLFVMLAGQYLKRSGDIGDDPRDLAQH